MTGPLELEVEQPGEPETVRRLVYQPYVLIGRDADNDLALDADGVRPRHAYLQVVAGRVFWVDLSQEAPAGAHRWRRRRGWFGGGQPLDVGPFRVRLVNDTPREDPGAVPAEDPWASRSCQEELLPAVRLEFIKKSRQMLWLMNRILVLLGRSAGCKVQLEDASVADVHCSLVRTPDGVWVVDLGGGIRVNGAPAIFAPLADGDQVQVGRFGLGVRYVGPVSPEPSVATALSTTAGPTGRLPANGAPHQGMLLPAQSWGAASLRGAPALATGRLPGPLAESVLVPMVQQFALLQQQMFDQFQQALVMMAQTFGTLHQEQMASIRAELNSLHEVTRELQALQLELAKQPSDAPPASAVSPPATAPSSPGAAGSGPQRPAPVLSPGNGAGVKAVPPLPAAEGPAASQPTDRPAASPPNQDTHAWLCQRIAALQQERQGRWQKIVHFMFGQGNGGGAS
jgi:pSer/pThr/pTyr-binding forkhead associated (FHA) protein